MALFQLSKEAKNDLRSIALFTENHWSRAQPRYIYLR